MAFEFCCFISYPHGQNDVLKPFINNFVEGLETEIGAQTRKKVFVDYKYLQGGNWLDKEIGPSLCKSVCMILFYTPLYFDTEHIYCARELKAMEKLEKQRMDTLTDKGKGLIIPIILRGEKKFPQTISKERLYYDFTDIVFGLSEDPKETIKVKYARQIREIAEYIVDRCDQLDSVNNPSHNCDAYILPDEQEAREFVEIVLGKKIVEVAVPFVIRTEEPASV